MNHMNNLEQATDQFRAFLTTLSTNSHIVILHDSDADGVTSGVLLQRALERIGYTAVARVIPNRERDAWTDANRQLVRESRPDALFVLDLGSRDQAIVDGVPTCFIDHHRPEGVPPGGTLISGHAWIPSRTHRC